MCSLPHEQGKQIAQQHMHADTELAKTRWTLAGTDMRSDAASWHRSSSLSCLPTSLLHGRRLQPRRPLQ
jgi:hypothetical protein